VGTLIEIRAGYVRAHRAGDTVYLAESLPELAPFYRPTMEGYLLTGSDSLIGPEQLAVFCEACAEALGGSA